MNNTFLNALKNYDNYMTTENGALAHKTTGGAVYDLFAFGGAYRSRSDADVITLFSDAFDEDPSLAMKCLFYLRDCRGGQGERRFFRVAYRWLAKNYTDYAKRNLKQIPIFGRWDDLLYCTTETPIEEKAEEMMADELCTAVAENEDYLAFKWAPSINASNKTTRKLAYKLASFMDMSPRDYRTFLSSGREKARVLEKLMSGNRWDEINFKYIPAKAGINYSAAFARRPETAERYKEFINNKETKVNADTLYPYEIVRKALTIEERNDSLDATSRAAINKYWENLPDYFDGASNSMICVVDTSRSMTWTENKNVRPIDIAISLGMYCAEHLSGAFKNCYISFSSHPQLINIAGADFVDKVNRIYDTNICGNTDLKAVFELIKNIAIRSNVRKEDLPKTIIVISDMQIDQATTEYCSYCQVSWTQSWTQENIETEMEGIRRRFKEVGLEMPKLVYWNVDARENTILDLGPDVSFVSGASPTIFKSVLTGKTGTELMMETLLAPRYSAIY